MTTSSPMRTSEEPLETTRVTSDLMRLLRDKLRLHSEMHTYKFDCIEAGDNAAFELIETMQRQEAIEIEGLRKAVQGRT